MRLAFSVRNWLTIGIQRLQFSNSHSLKVPCCREAGDAKVPSIPKRQYEPLAPTLSNRQTGFARSAQGTLSHIRQEVGPRSSLSGGANGLETGRW